MAEQGNVAILMAGLAAFNENDMEALEQYVDPSVTYILRGQAEMCGTHQGRDAMSGALNRIKELTDNSMTLEPLVVMTQGERLMAYTKVTGGRADGRRYDSQHAYVCEIRDGKLVDMDTIPADQKAFTEFLAD